MENRPPNPDIEPRSVAFDGGALRGIREFIAAEAQRAGLGDEKANDLVLAVHEVATNSVRHGGGQGLLRVWLGWQHRAGARATRIGPIAGLARAG